MWGPHAKHHEDDPISDGAFLVAARALPGFFVAFLLGQGVISKLHDREQVRDRPAGGAKPNSDLLPVASLAGSVVEKVWESGHPRALGASSRKQTA